MHPVQLCTAEQYTLAVNVGLAAGIAGPRASGGATGSEEEEGEGEEGAADFLSPRPSRAEQRRQQRRMLRAAGPQAGGAAAAAPGAAEREAEEAGPPGQQRGRRRRQKQPLQEGAGEPGPSEAGEGGSEGSGALVSGDFGYWERHGTGIGGRLLQKWGFKGEGAGLGREGRGIAEPVQAQRRPKALGLGAFK